MHSYGSDNERHGRTSRTSRPPCTFGRWVHASFTGARLSQMALKALSGSPIRRAGSNACLQHCSGYVHLCFSNIHALARLYRCPRGASLDTIHEFFSVIQLQQRNPGARSSWHRDGSARRHPHRCVRIDHRPNIALPRVGSWSSTRGLSPPLFLVCCLFPLRWCFNSRLRRSSASTSSETTGPPAMRRGGGVPIARHRIGIRAAAGDRRLCAVWVGAFLG